MNLVTLSKPKLYLELKMKLSASKIVNNPLLHWKTLCITMKSIKVKFS